MIKTEGIILKELRYKDASKILKIYTREHGKISVMAQGALKPKSNMMAATEVFSCCEFQLRKGKEFYYISQADILDSHYSLRESIDRVSYGFYILELLNKSLPDEQSNEKIYELLKKGLKALSESKDDYLKLIVAYELKFVSFLGYRPHITSCVSCGRELSIPVKFSNILGGALCRDCTSMDLQACSTTNGILEASHRLLMSALDDLDNVDLDNHVLNKIHELIVQYILFNIDLKEFKSLNILKNTI